MPSNGVHGNIPIWPISKVLATIRKILTSYQSISQSLTCCPHSCSHMGNDPKESCGLYPTIRSAWSYRIRSTGPGGRLKVSRSRSGQQNRQLRLLYGLCWRRRQGFLGWQLSWSWCSSHGSRRNIGWSIIPKATSSLDRT